MTTLPGPSFETESTPADGEVHSGQLRMAYRLARKHGHELKHVHQVGWFVWDGTRWIRDTNRAAHRLAIKVLTSSYSEAVRRDDKQLLADVRKCESDAGIRGTLAIAAGLEPISTTAEQLDADPYLLNCANGTFDLRTGQLRAHDPADLLSQITRAAYRPDVGGDTWRTFLERVLPVEEVRGYFQRYIGLSLLGLVREHVFAIAVGTGANGKGASYTAILHALGTYGHTAESDLFMAGRSNRDAASPGLMALRGKRLVVVSETERDHRLATALMKNLTGGDAITTRPLYGEQVTFEASHSALMVTNHLPKVAGDDPAAWRRIRVIPFDVVIPENERDARLGERLRLEADAILTWAIDGYRAYETANGLATPKAVLAATDGYRADMDTVSQFLNECTEQGLFVELSRLYERWARWSAQEKAEPLGKRQFGEAISKHGYPSAVRSGVSVRNGISLKPEAETGVGFGAE